MRTIHHIYLSEKLAKNRSAVMSALCKNHFPSRCYLITLSAKDNRTISICSGRHILTFFNSYKDDLVVGAAGSKRAAFLLMEGIASDCIRHTSRTDLGTYLLGCEKNLHRKSSHM